MNSWKDERNNNRGIHVRPRPERSSNDVQMIDYDVSSNLHSFKLDDLIDSDDDEYFTQHEENVYRELLQGLQLWLKRYFRIYVHLYRKQILFGIGIFSIIYFIITIPATDSPTKNIPILSTPLDNLIFPNLNSLYPNEKFNESIGLFDFRLSSGLLLRYIQNHIIHNDMRLTENFRIPFSWSDWVNLDTKLQFNQDFFVEWLSYHSDEFQNNLEAFKRLDCHYFSLLFGIESNKDFKRQCEDIGTDLNAQYPYSFFPSGPTSAKMKEPGRVLYAAAYLKMKMPPPSKIYMMNVFGSSGGGSLVVNVNEDIISDKILRSPSVLKSFIESFCSENDLQLSTFLEKGWTIRDLRKSFAKTMKKTFIGKIIYPNEHRKIDTDETYMVVRNPDKYNKMRMSEWSFDDFQWDEVDFLEKLSLKAAISDNNYDTKLYEHIDELEQHRINTGKHPKYFHEAQLYGTTIGSHYDWRFFTASTISDDYRQSIIHRLARTWLRFCFENEIKTFIAYGSMVGWINNGLTLPWDGDIDVIVTMDSFNLLARNFNQTLLVDYSEDDGFQSAMTGYLVDINPAYYSRVKGDGANVIDGRLIDISTGIYLDITALAWTKDYLTEVKLTKKLRKIIDKDYEINRIFALEGEIYDITLIEQLRTLQSNKELVHCKNDNAYKIEELTKMIPSYFEGVRAYFPHRYLDIIQRFYPKALTTIIYSDHVYDEAYRLWVSFYDCPAYSDGFGNVLDDVEFGTCNDSVVLQEYRLTKDYTERHEKMMKNGDFSDIELSAESESPPFRVDEFFIIYNTLLGFNNSQLEKFYKHQKD